MAVEGCPLADVLEERLRFGRLLADLTAAFVDLRLDEIDAQIEHSLRTLGQFLEVDRSSLAEFSEDRRDMVVRYSYVAEGIEPFPPVIVDGVLPWYAEQIRQGAVVRFAHLPDGLPPEAAAEREYCIREGLKSNLAIPLTAGETLRCVLTFATFRDYRQWPDDLVQRLWLAGQVFANSLQRKRSAEKARNLRDQLARMGRVTLVGELAAMIAHEIRQPLCAILSNAQAGHRLLAADQPDLGEIRDTLRDIASDSQRANEVVTRVRGMLQKRITECAPLDLNVAIQEVLAVAQWQLTQTSVTVLLDLAPDLPPVLGDRVQLQQVMLNLVLNAVEAMNRPDIKSRQFSIHTRRHADDRVMVRVRDSGAGIDPGDLDLVFDSFFTTKPTGIGLGLAISRSIVESHGGRIEVNSQPGHGAEFQFTLRVAQEPVG